MEDPDPLLFVLSDINNLNGIFLGMSIEALGVILLIVSLLFMSSLLSGSEIAFFSISPSQKEEIISGNSDILKQGLELLNVPKKLLAAILISNNFVNIAIVLFSTFLTDLLFDFSEYIMLGVVFQIVVITSALLLFGEIMPKIFAREKPMLFVKLMSKPLNFIMVIFKPLINLLSMTTNLIDKRLEKKKPQFSMKDLSDVVELAGELENAEVEEEEHKMLKGIATFGDTEVKEIMKARVDVSALDINTGYKDVISFIKDCGYSRIPVFKDSIDSIVGVLYIKDLLSYLNQENFKWQEKLRPSFFVPENKKINDLLQEFREKKIHMAIVVDEYGGTSGIVTLEDVLEEIVGEISDEFDIENEEFQFVRVNDSSWVFEAKMNLIDLCKIIEIDNQYFDEIKGESDSIAGLMLEIKGYFPTLNEKINYKNLEFEILNMDKRRISRIRVTKL